MQIARSSGLINKMTEKMQPLLHFLFPKIPKEHPAMEYISANVIANFLGLGWGATPLGLKAIEELAKLEEERKGKKPKSASNEMCTFLVMNISSLQLIPVNIIAYRSQYHSTSPAAVTGPCFAATMVSTLAAVIFCKIMDHLRNPT